MQACSLSVLHVPTALDSLDEDLMHLLNIDGGLLQGNQQRGGRRLACRHAMAKALDTLEHESGAPDCCIEGWKCTHLLPRSRSLCSSSLHL